MTHSRFRQVSLTALISAALVGGSLFAFPATAFAEDDLGVTNADDSAFLEAQYETQKQYQAENPVVTPPDAAAGESLALPPTEPLPGQDDTLDGEFETQADRSAFRPGLIMSDATLYNGSAFSESETQAFLNAINPSCTTASCLRLYSQSTQSRSANPMCGAYQGAANEPASRILAKVGQACGISQKYLLVLLQKESSLVTLVNPAAWRYTQATGYACPDTAACDANYGGFFNQVYWAAWQIKRYGNPPGTSNFFNWFPVGATSNIGYNPNAACGSSPVYIENKATAAFYYYTPYQPNPATIAGYSDGCNAYGNLNTFTIYSDWFGSPVTVSPPIGRLDSITTRAGAIDVSGWGMDPANITRALDTRVYIQDPNGQTKQYQQYSSLNRPDIAAAYPGAGSTHGFVVSAALNTSGMYWVCVSISNVPGTYWISLGCRWVMYSAGAGGTPTVDRISGTDRYDVAVNVSKQSVPAGQTAPVVYVATGENWPDALSAAPAAAKEGAPLLLVGSTSIPGSVVSEIQRLRPGKIVVVGGVASVSEPVVNQLKTLQANTVRVGGADRYEASRNIVSYAFGASGASSAFIATGQNFPDTLSAGGASGSKGQPVLIVDGSAAAFDSQNSALLTSLGVTTLSIAGGPNSVNTVTETALKAIAPTTRYGGSDRYTASVSINKSAFNQASRAFITTGLKFPDGLSGSAYSAKLKAPMFVSPAHCVPLATLNEIAKSGASRVTLLGGTATLSAQVAAFQPC